MPPVPVHIDDQITPSIASTAADDATTTSKHQQPAYPAAQPGAAAVPAPTPYVSGPQPQPPPTRTTPMSSDSPPAPQPGAVPAPFSQQTPKTVPSPLPPPPKPGEAAAFKKAQVTQPPPQMALPPPQPNYAPVHGTQAASPTQIGEPATINYGAAPAPQIRARTHPPGYHQDANAQELSSGARASLEQQERRESFANNFGLGGDGTNETATNMWNTVKAWANTAGTSLAEAEKQVWERINKKS